MLLRPIYFYGFYQYEMSVRYDIEFTLLYIILYSIESATMGLIAV